MRFAYGDWVTATFVATCFFFSGSTVLGCINETAPHYRATARAEATTATATSLAASAWHGRRYPWGHEDSRQRTEDRIIRRHEVEARHCLAQIICDAQTPTGQASTSITLAQVADAVADGVVVEVGVAVQALLGKRQPRRGKNDLSIYCAAFILVAHAICIDLSILSHTLTHTQMETGIRGSLNAHVDCFIMMMLNYCNPNAQSQSLSTSSSSSSASASASASSSSLASLWHRHCQHPRLSGRYRAYPLRTRKNK